MTVLIKNLISVKNLYVHFPIRQGMFSRITGYVRAVDGVSLTIPYRQTYALVGESGCGKTTTGRAILRLIKSKSDELLFDGMDINSLQRKELSTLRRRMQIVFQDPFSSLNPRMNVMQIIAEGLHIHHIGTQNEREESVIKTLELCGLSSEYAYRYPHELSGGQRQRVGIARALAVNPQFVVCDEAVSALDVSVQASIINLLMDSQERFDLSYLFISHDLTVVRHISNRVGVMYLGKIVEEADTESLFNNPLHPYTQALLSAVPSIDPRERKQRILLTGDVPRADKPPLGCRFHTRCPRATEMCKSGDIPVCEVEPGHKVQCVLYVKQGD